MRTATPALAVAFLPREIDRIVRNIALILVGTVVLTIAAKIKVPFWPVPMTLQTLGVMALAAAYGSRLAVVTVAVYLLEGFAGLPVFTNTPPAAAGPAYFLGSTGGFLVGFLVAAWIIGAVADRGWGRSVGRLFGAMLAADLVVMLLGYLWLAWFAVLSNGATGLGLAGAFSAGVAPFLLADLVKIAFAACLIPAGWALLGRPAE